MTPLHQEIQKVLVESSDMTTRELLDALVTLSNVKGERNRLIHQVREETIEECIKVASVHIDHIGDYCDTGEDMDWACRSECVQMAVDRLQALKEKK